MYSSGQTGRWVIVLGDSSAPVFWSIEREALEDVCVHVRRTCPTARVIWQDRAGDTAVPEPRANASREVRRDNARQRK